MSLRIHQLDLSTVGTRVNDWLNMSGVDSLPSTCAAPERGGRGGSKGGYGVQAKGTGGGETRHRSHPGGLGGRRAHTASWPVTKTVIARFRPGWLSIVLGMCFTVWNCRVVSFCMMACMPWWLVPSKLSMDSPCCAHRGFGRWEGACFVS